MNKKRVVSVACLICGVPLLLALGVWLIGTERYAAVSAGVALLSCVPVAVTFEKSKKSGRELAVLAVLNALTVVGRVIFAPVPGFKPVTAMTVIAGVAFGAEAGFMTGSMSALISNIYFGQDIEIPNVSNFIIKNKKLILKDNYLSNYEREILLKPVGL